MGEMEGGEEGGGEDQRKGRKHGEEVGGDNRGVRAGKAGVIGKDSGVVDLEGGRGGSVER